MERAAASGCSSSTTCEASSRVGTRTSAAGWPGAPAVRPTSGKAKASVLPEPGGEPARTSTPARASGKTRVCTANGAVMPRRDSAWTIGALTPSAANDSFNVHSLRAGVETKRLETPEKEDREAESHGATCDRAYKVAAGGRPATSTMASVTATAESRSALVEDLIERFPHIPPEAVLKEDLLRTGIEFDESALTDNLDGEVKPKSYFIFSFDQKPLAQLGEAARRRPPEEIALTGGPYELRRTIVSVRVNPDSPYRASRDEDGALRLSLEGRSVADITLPPMPEYYRHTL